MKRLSQARSTAGIIRDTFEVYGRNFRVIFIASLVSLPFAVLQDAAMVRGVVDGESPAPYHLPVAVIGLSVNYVASLFATSLVTITVSYAYKGFTPSLSRTFRRLAGLPLGKMLLTYVPFLLLPIGAAYLVQFAYESLEGPGLLQPAVTAVVAFAALAFITLTLFIPCVVVIEAGWGWPAYRRSAALGGYQLRFFLRHLLLVLAYIVFYVVSLAVTFFVVRAINWTAGSVFKNLLLAFVGPLGSVCVALLYNDICIRKEGRGYVEFEDVMQD